MKKIHVLVGHWLREQHKGFKPRDRNILCLGAPVFHYMLLLPKREDRYPRELSLPKRDSGGPSLQQLLKTCEEPDVI